MEIYIPDIYQKSIFTINYESLLLKGIKCLLFDLDNTISPVSVKNSSKKVSDLFDELKEMGFKIIVFSNSGKKRLKPFKDELDVDCCYHAQKPFKKKFLKVMTEYDYDVIDVAIIGDQLLTDIKGGNKVGITTVLVNPLGTNEKIYTKFNRFFENIICKKLRKNDLFVKGKYYD